ncbi:MAG: hypothetical protein GYB31_09405 [Bacteroidetes bacterium]|nr:hypothetical protein [Bacteroidota bacterium]
MEQVSRPTSAKFRLNVNKDMIDLFKIIAFGSVFPLIYLLGKFITQL